MKPVILRTKYRPYTGVLKMLARLVRTILVRFDRMFPSIHRLTWVRCSE